MFHEGFERVSVAFQGVSEGFQAALRMFKSVSRSFRDFRGVYRVSELIKGSQEEWTVLREPRDVLE